MAKLTYDSWVEESHRFSINDASKGALSVLRWAYQEYGDELVYACSFGVEGIVMIDLISQFNPDAKVVFLDTGLHFQETYELIEKVKQHYPYLNIEMKQPALTVEEQAQKYGDRLWERQPNRCCHYRKVVPLRETLSSATAWLSGLRREQSPTRSQTNFINKDENFQSVKVCPLIHWTWKDIWEYVKKNQLPYNALHDRGYPSIGCAPCTSTGDMTTGSRSGRWENQSKTECGLHTI
ncbi:phosphoadenylyl-sulfate reductase [Sporosarcina sp. HYO08]|uniref:phosphoadenylyl-sulfate reductase n=1 Tax=Sporosarcina sp. HYO08 TaxID=1759557 RepID=UPI00079AFFA6|nr:phosphoadenylyl-sulfate reductase [Sporosarcina sp. HYO08]KXH81796.1 phosphoadenosine phosphosulfate reductase [Sporosarcina sp. HYO08]